MARHAEAMRPRSAACACRNDAHGCDMVSSSIDHGVRHGSTHRTAQISQSHRRRRVGPRPKARTSRRGALRPGPVTATGRTLASIGGGRDGGAERDRPARVYRMWLLDPPAEQARTGGRDVRGLWRADAVGARSRPPDVDGSPALRGATPTRAPGRRIDRCGLREHRLEALRHLRPEAVVLVLEVTEDVGAGRRAPGGSDPPTPRARRRRTRSCAAAGSRPAPTRAPRAWGRARRSRRRTTRCLDRAAGPSPRSTTRDGTPSRTPEGPAAGSPRTARSAPGRTAGSAGIGTARTRADRRAASPDRGSPARRRRYRASA